MQKKELLESFLQKRTGRASIISLLTVILVIVSLASISMMQTNSAVAASNIPFKQKFTGNLAFAEKIIREGSTTTGVSAVAFETINGDTMCVSVSKFDDSTGTSLIEWQTCGPARLTIGTGLSSATFSATLSERDFATGTDKTVTVTGDLTATGKVQMTTSGTHMNTPDFLFVAKFHGKSRPAIGSLNLQGDITLNIDDATGRISKESSGYMTVQKK
jgi:hypothetical protein